MRRIIFLDIDGVLNSVRYDRERRENDGNIDETRLVLLKGLIDTTGAEIVLSSSWRKHWGSMPEECDAIGDELNMEFCKFGLTVTDKTPVLSAIERGIEIKAWLDDHADEVGSFVILDDMFFGFAGLEEHFVKTDSRIGRGLEERHVEKARRILLGE